MDDPATTLEEVLYYADFWLTLADKAYTASGRGNSGEAEASAYLAVKMAYDRFKASLERYTKITNPPDNVGELAAILQAEVNAMMEGK